MAQRVYTFLLDLDWKMIQLLSQIDRFDAQWSAWNRPEEKGLKELRSLATVKSVGASNRIEGNKMTDEAVAALLQNIDISSLTDRDAQEVVGCFEANELILEAYPFIDLTENSIKSLHNSLLKHSTRDHWHKGDYKMSNNAIEAGFPTEDAMRQLIQWFLDEKEVHSLLKIACFTYEFLSIHPFQDGNGRLSRLLSMLLLLKEGYHWIRYVSFEHEIERRKTEYYATLQRCQSQRPGEDVTEWVKFFVDCLAQIQTQLQTQLLPRDTGGLFTPKENAVLHLLQIHPQLQSSEVAEKLGYALPTVKRLLATLLAKGLIAKHGKGRAVHYTLR
jgi:Fic family protein